MVCHARKGRFVARHNEVRDELAYIATFATNSGSIRNKPLINIGRGARLNSPATAQVQGTKTQSPMDNISQPHKGGRFFDQGDLQIRSFFGKQTIGILDVRVCNIDTPSYIYSSSVKILLKQEKEKMKKYLEACLEQRHHFAPYICNTYRFLEG